MDILNIFSKLFEGFTKKVEQNKVAKQRGKEGEELVTSFISKLPDSKVLNNVILEKNKHFTQIDHIIITPYKVYVVETKNIAGYVVGSEESKNWSVRYLNGKVYSLYNPVMQNNGHIRALSKALGGVILESVVVFVSPRCKLNMDIEGVYTLDSFQGYILSEIQRNKKVCIDVDNIYKKIKKLDKSKGFLVVKRQENYAKKKAKTVNKNSR